MMNFVYIVGVYSLLVRLSFSGCHTGSIDDAAQRWLGIQTNRGAQNSNAKFFANIYANGAWDGWRRLDNVNCDDHVPGEYDYFDDFEDITSKWEGIAFYHCAQADLFIEGLYYWDGSAKQAMWYWDSNVFGPFNQQCLFNDASQASKTDPNNAYSDILIGSDCPCQGVTFRPDGKYGRLWTGALPGAPNCAANEHGEVPVVPDTIPKPSKYAPYINTNTDFEEKLVDYLMTVIGIAALLFVSNSCLITVLVKKNIPQHEYGKVYKTDME